MKDLSELGKGVAAQHGWPAAKAFKTWKTDEAAGAILTRKALDILRVMPKSLDRSALTGAYAVHLLRDWDAPLQVVAGRLRVEGGDAFVEPLSCVDKLKGAEGWSGDCNHLWIMIGSQIVDIALFRAAYSAEGSAQLAHFVNLQFGSGKALYVDDWRLARRRGLSYEPVYVLGADEVTAIMADAYHAGEALARRPCRR